MEKIIEILKKVPVVLDAATIEALAGWLAPLILKPEDIEGRVLVGYVPMTGAFDDEVLRRMYAYGDHIRAMGAKAALFLPMGTKVETLCIKEGDKIILHVDNTVSTDQKNVLAEWCRIAGGGKAGVAIFPAGVNLELNKE